MLILLYLLAYAYSDEDVCNVLIFSGGGDHGAYEVGAVQAITEFTNMTYQVITATSIGAINAALYGQYKLGDEVEASQYLTNFWTNVKREDIYVNWKPGGVVEGFFLKSGLFNNNETGAELAKKFLNVEKLRNSGRKLMFGATDLMTHKFHYFDEQFHDIKLALQASVAIPGFFPPVKLDGRIYCDGFVSQNTPISLGVHYCEEKYYPGVKINADVLYAVGDLNYPELLDFQTTPFIFFRAMFGVFDNWIEDDLQYIKINFPNAKVRIFQPKGVFLPGMFIGFEHKHIMEMIKMGYDDAKKVITGE